MGVDVSPRAVEEIRKAAARRAKAPKGLRVGIRGGGCTGFSYLFEWSDDEPRAQDKVLEPEAGVRVFIDPKSLVFLEGSTLDYATTMMARGFKWVNPNAKGTCGCGESVQF
jgi:iron-sulfur cluster assembly protein